MSQQDDEPDFEALLEYLKNNRGFDFTGYKRTSLQRRINKRMETAEIAKYKSYVDYLEVHPDEFGKLFDTILINVTAFFRDEGSWEFLASDIIPRIAANKKPGEAIRVWSAGCASGEEAYTLAMVLSEVLGQEFVRDRVKVYATDVDPGDLNKARQASYTDKEVEGVPASLLQKYFDLQNNRYLFHKDLRRSVIFGRHDLIQDAPISRIDLLVCRNTLMYFNADVQARILERFHFALVEQGYLFLGKAETLLSYNNSFKPIELKRRFFIKVPRNQQRGHLIDMMRSSNGESAHSVVDPNSLWTRALDANPVAQIVIDRNGVLALINERARALFGIGSEEVGRPLQDLQLSYRPVELRSCLDQAFAEHRTVLIKDVEWKTLVGDPTYLDVQIVPLLDSSSAMIGANISYTDVTTFKRLYHDLQVANQELETAYEELQSTNEELETTNEELQSTNEELETMNEELQSTNEELETLNQELAQSGEEYNRVNVFLESILGGMRCGVAVIDSDMLVRTWNSKAEDLWGLRSEEVLGKHFLNLEIGLPVEQLRQPIRSCLEEQESDREVKLAALNRRGKTFQCKVSCTPLVRRENDKGGIILLMEEVSTSP